MLGALPPARGGTPLHPVLTNVTTGILQDTAIGDCFQIPGFCLENLVKRTKLREKPGISTSKLQPA
jgi:hypothetical protein